VRVEQVSTRPLHEKLGVRAGQRVSVLGRFGAEFLATLDRHGVDGFRRPRRASDLIFLLARSLADLERIAALEPYLVDNGALWVVSRKGREATMRDVDVIAAAKRAGLVDNKVVSFSDTHTALRLVIPVVRRKGRGRPDDG